MNPVLELDRVSRSFGTGDLTVWALREVFLTVYRGEFVAVMGPSGSGKSTLLGVAGGLDTGHSGSVRVDGVALETLNRSQLAVLRRRKVGFVFQDYNLVPSLTARENVMLPLELDGVNDKKARGEAGEALERVGVPELADRFIDQMSGGQRQRVAIARAMVGGRCLILADEPTGALDTATGEQIMEVLRTAADAGLAVVLVTHSPRFAGWSDRTIFVRDGRVIDEARAMVDPDSLLAEGR